DQLTVKGGVSTGFRAPDVRNIAPGYAYTTGGRNCTYGPDGSCGVIIADPNLKAESSTSYEVGVLWDSFSGFTAGATLFHTEFKDKIVNSGVLDSEGNPVRWEEDPNYVLWYNYNIDDARIRGVELTASWDATDTLSLRSSYTYTDSEQLTGEYAGFPLARTPKHMANIRADWATPVEGLNAWLSANYHGSEVNAGQRIGNNGEAVGENGEGRVIARKYPSYATVDLGASYKFNESVELKGAVYNLFDKKVEATEFNTTMEGRRFWVGMTSTF